jgi:hypothetical protein
MYKPIKNGKLTRPNETTLEPFWIFKAPKTLLPFRRASNPPLLFGASRAADTIAVYPIHPPDQPRLLSW